MGSVNHKTRETMVWVDVDLGVAEFVERLNTIFGVRTHSSCQGTIGEGGPEPYGPFVEISWVDHVALGQVQMFSDVEIRGESWGTARPKVT